jgi:hypothetical protein
MAKWPFRASHEPPSTLRAASAPSLKRYPQSRGAWERRLPGTAFTGC